MDLFQQFFQNVQFPLLSAFIMGALVAVHPCPLATNVAAMGYVAREGVDNQRIFRYAMVYILGRTLAYALLGVLLLLMIRGGADLLNFSDVLTEWGERLLAPVLIFIGLYLLYNDLLHHHDHVPSAPAAFHRLRGGWGCLLLGIFFALAFCPESGIVYFGMIVPMSVESSWGGAIPLAFALGSALPVLIMAWMMVRGIDTLKRTSRRMACLQKWLTRMVAVMFIFAGVFCLFV